MREFYGSGQRGLPLSSPTSGQLVAIRAEEEEEILRARVCDVMDDKVKVRRRLTPGKEAPVTVGVRNNLRKSKNVLLGGMT